MRMILGVATMSRGRGTADTITEAIFTIVAEQGLDRATVREVAGAAGVSIGTVQHHFPTKDAMLEAAFSEVVRRVRTRLDAIEFHDDVRRNILVVLEEILPLDQRRSNEARVQLAFAVRAMNEPSLAAAQRAVLGELHDALSRALTVAFPSSPQRSRAGAHAILALADGMALHALSTEGWVTSPDIHAAVGIALEKLTVDAGQTQ